MLAMIVPAWRLATGGRWMTDGTLLGHRRGKNLRRVEHPDRGRWNAVSARDLGRPFSSWRESGKGLFVGGAAPLALAELGLIDDTSSWCSPGWWATGDVIRGLSAYRLEIRAGWSSAGGGGVQYEPKVASAWWPESPHHEHLGPDPNHAMKATAHCETTSASPRMVPLPNFPSRSWCWDTFYERYVAHACRTWRQ